MNPHPKQKIQQATQATPQMTADVPLQLQPTAPLYTVLKRHKEMACAVELLRGQIFHLSDDERMQIFDAVRHGYCADCGSKSQKCHCTNDD